jgi:YrbI family 3-deoxy-D-manno-octulosonate 8-phosphate phosphatase
MAAEAIADGLTVAIIPARGGSVGIPRKNLAVVHGSSLIARAVHAARAAAGIDLVAVSTDDAEIAAEALAAGAVVIDRPAALAGPESASESALLHALDSLELTHGRVDVVAFVQATSPFHDSAALGRAVARVRKGSADVVIAVTPTYEFLWRQGEDGLVAVNHDSTSRARRQDRSPDLRETGAFYVMRASGLRASGNRFFGRIGAEEVAPWSAIEVDEPSDLEVARALAGIIERPPTLDVDALVTDFDGVHTDNTVRVFAGGRESVRVSRADGLGISRLRAAGVRLLILSQETHPLVARRAAKLGIEVIDSCTDKASALREWAVANGIDLERIAYLGNDVNDVPPMLEVGWPIAVADAYPEARSAARLVLLRSGGEGAVREVADMILTVRNTREP